MHNLALEPDKNRVLILRMNGLLNDLIAKGTELEKWVEMASVYFSHLGPLLRDGHVSQAREVADLVQMRLG